MKLRVMADLTRSDGIVRLHEVSAGGTDTIEYSAGTVGLTLAELQDRLVPGARPTNIAANGGAALIAGRNGHSRISAPGSCRLCSGRWGFRRPFCLPVCGPAHAQSGRRDYA